MLEEGPWWFVPRSFLIHEGEQKEEHEWAREEISDEGPIDSGPWVVRGNPMGFLKSENEKVIDGWSLDFRESRFMEMTKGEWVDVARFLLLLTAPLVG